MGLGALIIAHPQGLRKVHSSNGLKVPADSIPQAHTWLLDGVLASGVQESWLRTGRWMYNAVVQDTNWKSRVILDRRSK